MSPEAVNVLVNNHIKDAHNIACSILKRWKARIDQDELTSAINLTLCQAVENFNPKFGTKFTTFLHYYLNGKLARTIKSEVEKDIPNSDTVATYQAQTEELTSESVKEIYEKKDSHLKMLTVISNLEKLEREIIEGVYLHDLSIQDLAARLKLSRGYVSRVKTEALRKMRGYVKNKAS